VIDVDRFFVIFVSIVYEAMPFIILGALISGTLEELLPQQWLARMIPKRRWLAIAGSALLGLIFPMCECGIVPVMRRLLGKGLPLSCAVAYMLAAPIINPVVIGSTWAAFSGDRSKKDGLTSVQMVTLRVGLGFVTAFVTASVVEAVVRRRGVKSLVLIAPKAGHPDHVAEEGHSHHHSHNHSGKHGHAECGHDHHDHDQHHHEHGEGCNHGHDHAHVAEHPASQTHKQTAEGTVGLKALPLTLVRHNLNNASDQPKPIFQRILNISETALRDFVDITAFLILGAILAAMFQTFRIIEYLPELSTNPVLATLIMMVLAVLLCLCSEADAFVVANMIQIPLSGKLGFLVLGPMMDLKLYMMYTRVFRTPLIWTIIPVVAVCVFVLSLAAGYLAPLLFP